mmetsp:Transcript_576/g.1835  ORF Transcript_576/g.1835 Transcript_576/m.1835 type:complete len:201 (-) Transcript_576:434-1036(-)
MARPATYLHGMAFLAASLLALASSPASAAAPWSPAAYPNPMIDVGACGRQGVTSRICDPDSILTYDAANVVESYLKEIAEGVEPFKPGDCAGEAKGFQAATGARRLPSRSCHLWRSPRAPRWRRSRASLLSASWMRGAWGRRPATTASSSSSREMTAACMWPRGAARRAPCPTTSSTKSSLGCAPSSRRGTMRGPSPALW